MYVCMYVCMYVGDVAVFACVLVLPHLEDGVAVAIRRRKHREGRALRRRRCVSSSRRLQRHWNQYRYQYQYQ